MKKIALICFDNPFLKPMEGGKRGMLSRIEALSQTNYIVDIYLMSKPEEYAQGSFTPLKNSNFTYYHYMIQVGKRLLLSSYPLSVAKRYIPECADQLAKKYYDAAIYEGEHVSEYRVRNVVHAKRHIIYMHDIESAYRHDLSKSETSAVKKIGQEIESIKYRKLEDRIASMFDRWLFVSCDEKKTFEKRFPQLLSKCIYSPYATGNFAAHIVTNDNHNDLLYIGNLRLRNNYLSLLWFVKEVFPLIIEKRPEARLNIVGNISQEDKSSLEQASSQVIVNGYVPDLDDVVRNSCCIISPVLYGAGVKVKIIDALAYGQIVITNNKAIEGTELINRRHLLVAETKQQYADYCCRVLNDRSRYIEIAQEGLKYVSSVHSIEYHKQVLIGAIEN